MAPPNDGCSLFLRDLDEPWKYARGRGRCQITIAAGRWALRAWTSLVGTCGISERRFIQGDRRRPVRRL